MQQLLGFGCVPSNGVTLGLHLNLRCLVLNDGTLLISAWHSADRFEAHVPPAGLPLLGLLR